MIINVFHISSCRMLEGDGFDFSSHGSPPKGKSSATMKKSTEDWLSNRKKCFIDKNTNKERLMDSNRDREECNNLSDIKLYVSNQFSLLINEALSLHHVFFFTSRHIRLKQQYSQLFFLSMAIVYTTRYQNAQSVWSF
jgi:hypothetical protein